jgi:hypothetical protein
MSDAVAQLQKATQNLGRAYNAYQGSSFMKYFAAKLLPELSESQRSMRLQVLRVGGQLVDTEFESAMDELVASWIEYRKVQDDG